MDGTTKAKILETYGLTLLCQETVGEWLIKLGFKYDCDVNNNYVGGNQRKDVVWYRWNFIYFCLLIEHYVFRWIQIRAED